jgi:hypothetical protein
MCSCKACTCGRNKAGCTGCCGCAGSGSSMLSRAYEIARADTRSQATERFLRLMAQVKSQLVPQVQSAFGRRTVDQFEASLKMAAPALARAGARAARCMIRSKRMRPHVKLLPVIVRRTLIGIARQISQGREVSPAKAVRILARQTRACLRKGCTEALRSNSRARAASEGEGETDPGTCLRECERKFQECLNPPWWQFWKTPNPNQCLAERQVCQRGCRPVTPAGCGEGLCEGTGCEACCQFHCPNNLSECLRLCSPYR